MFPRAQLIEESPTTVVAPSGLRARLGRVLRQTAKQLLPAVIAREVRNWRAYEQTERPIYLKLRIENTLGFGCRAEIPKHARSFLFVCSGNIIRSPMCEALMNRALAAFPECIVTSAGLNAVPGRAAHPWAVAAAKEIGISLGNHRARLLSAEMVEQADVVLTMDYQNHVQVLSRFPAAEHKVQLLGAYSTKDHRPTEIWDPYYVGQAETRRCYDTLEVSIRNLASRIHPDSQAL